ncbi:MAG TPA: multicopper oxidase domain-containing protein [Flavobacteriales bacterium]|nr:multicopper oxidase domain-containing protein [Flavobacteriales bacterium]
MRFVTVLILLYAFNGFGNTVIKKLYINRGLFVTVKGTTFAYTAFNETSSFNQTNVCFYLKAGDTLVLWVKNNDTVQHGFKFKGVTSGYTINPTDSIADTLIYGQRSIHVFYDHLNYPDNKNEGLAGFIAVYSGSVNQCYKWNMKEHQSRYNDTLSMGMPVNWNNYAPDFFTINEKSYADLQLDTNAKVTAGMGDTVYIYVANTGQSMHSLHFHGFHSETVYEDAKIIQNGWIKDTWGLFSMDAVVLRMVPDKAGQYSVHDHNLVAITAKQTHPNGMFTIMTINP